MALVKPQFEVFSEPLLLDCGRELTEYRICYEAYGQLAPDRSNVLLLCHGLSVDAHAMGRHRVDDLKPGWWNNAIGPGHMLDTDKYFIICSNVIGGAGGSTGPGSINPATGQPFGMGFPIVTIPDMVRAQVRLIDRLNIARLHAVIGGCFGGHQALQWGAAHGDRTKGIVAMTVRAASAAYSIALWEVVRTAIRNDPAWCNGDYYGGPKPLDGPGLATAIALLQWMDPDFMQARYGRERVAGTSPKYSFAQEFAVEQMIGRVMVTEHASMDANCLLYLTRAADYFDLSAGHSSLSGAFLNACSEHLLVSYERDIRYPVVETEKLAEALRSAGRSVKHLVLDSPLSHGAFLYDLAGLDTAICKFLTQL